MSENLTNSSNSSEVPLIVNFQFYYTPFLVTTGAFGNIFTIFIFCKTKLKNLSTSYYLATLAISDNVFLFSLFIVWLKMIGIDIFNKAGMCQIIVYLTGICSFLNVWLVMAFTLERYVAVKYPFLRQTLCTTKRAKSVICILLACSVIISFPLIIFSTTINLENYISVCTVNPEWNEIANIFNYIDFVLTYLLPVTIVIFLNISISRTIINIANVRKILTNQNLNNVEKTKTRRMSTRLTQNKVTKMLLVVSTVFLCLNLPSYIMRLMTYLIELNLIEVTNIGIFQATQHWCLQLFYTNFGINFYLYCISGQNFRKALVGIFWKRTLQRTETIALTESRTASSRSSTNLRRRRTLSLCVEVKFHPRINQQINV